MAMKYSPSWDAVEPPYTEEPKPIAVCPVCGEDIYPDTEVVAVGDEILCCRACAIITYAEEVLS